MLKDKYSITDIALMTGLSDRTIRTYIKKGLLKGEKSDGIWIFSKEDINRFMNKNYVKQSVMIKNRALINDFIINNKKKDASICCIYDYPAENEEAGKIISEKVIEEINTNEFNGINMSYNFDVKNKIIRLIVIGPPDKIIELIQKCMPKAGI